jgi:hypothetical protein
MGKVRAACPARFRIGSSANPGFRCGRSAANLWAASLARRTNMSQPAKAYPDGIRQVTDA